MNGIGSFYYHWTAWYLFRLIDEFTMIIPLWIGIVKIMHDLNYSTYWLGMISIYNILLLRTTTTTVHYTIIIILQKNNKK